ncbi:DUF2663 family protein [Paenibacillus protaetiae]|uniref:DUF2663 family protein n=1 Tax=Paenibacillus protaetiae TaxID=2509456 RepID=A0A4P6EU89_9BACL|nr:DUF2663 family protein [Paenibacillus protaetiae]QAY66800.1 DUF2663 family protein [Paenibacillus protaetiae]
MSWRDHVSDDAKFMIDALVERKTKLDRLRAIATITVILFSVSFFPLATSFYKHTKTSKEDILNLFEGLFSHFFNFILILASITSLLCLHYLSQEISTAKKKYDTLRFEAIDRFYTSWHKTNGSALRDEISLYLKEKGINFVHKA